MDAGAQVVEAATAEAALAAIEAAAPNPGFQDHVVKPIDPSSLISRVGSLRRASLKVQSG